MSSGVAQGVGYGLQSGTQAYQAQRESERRDDANAREQAMQESRKSLLKAQAARENALAAQESFRARVQKEIEQDLIEVERLRAQGNLKEAQERINLIGEKTKALMRAETSEAELKQARAKHQLENVGEEEALRLERQKQEVQLLKGRNEYFGAIQQATLDKMAAEVDLARRQGIAVTRRTDLAFNTLAWQKTAKEGDRNFERWRTMLTNEAQTRRATMELMTRMSEGDKNRMQQMRQHHLNHERNMREAMEFLTGVRMKLWEAETQGYAPDPTTVEFLNSIQNRVLALESNPYAFNAEGVRAGVELKDTLKHSLLAMKNNGVSPDSPAGESVLKDILEQAARDLDAVAGPKRELEWGRAIEGKDSGKSRELGKNKKPIANSTLPPVASNANADTLPDFLPVVGGTISTNTLSADLSQKVHKTVVTELRRMQKSGYQMAEQDILSEVSRRTNLAYGMNKGALIAPVTVAGFRPRLVSLPGTDDIIISMVDSGFLPDSWRRVQGTVSNPYAGYVIPDDDIKDGIKSDPKNAPPVINELRRRVWKHTKRFKEDPLLFQRMVDSALQNNVINANELHGPEGRAKVVGWAVREGIK